MTEASSNQPNYLADFLKCNQDLIKAVTIPHEEVPSDALIVKSLVWTFQKVNPVLLVLDLRATVDKTKVARYLQTQPKHIRMATPELVLNVTGQTVGNVSPIGHKEVVRTIVDEALLTAHGINQSGSSANAAAGDVTCYGGGGSTGRELRISLREVLSFSGAEVADISASAAAAGPNAGADAVAVAGDVQDGAASGAATPISAPVDVPDSLTTNSDKYVKPAGSTAAADESSSRSSPTPLSRKDVLAMAKSIRDLAVNKDKFAELSVLLQSLQDSASGDAALVKEVINLGTSGSGKTALHQAAWKGAIESVTALSALGADVNQHSTGPGNYGKTAIFYALTQCRDDVVALLLNHGANVRIVNNKGQTPRSLAVSHVSLETTLLIEEAETSKDTEWLNFYSSNYCDKNTCFGDLDPRFHDLGGDLRNQLARGEISSLPRSINETTFAFRRGHYQSYNKMNHLLDDVVVSFLSAKQAGTPPFLEALQSPMPPLSVAVQSDGTAFVDGVLGRVTHIDAGTPQQCILSLKPIRAAEGDGWRLQHAAQDGDCETSDSSKYSASALTVDTEAQYRTVRMYLSREEGSTSSSAVGQFLGSAAFQHFCADLRVGQTIYANGTIFTGATINDRDVSGGTDSTLSLNAHRVALFSTTAPAVATVPVSKADRANAKKQLHIDADVAGAAAGIDADANNTLTAPPAVQYVTPSDIASSFHVTGNTAVPIVVVDSLSTLALLESDVSAMVREIETETSAESLHQSEHVMHRLPHVVGMDCEWRPGMVFVRRNPGDSLSPVSTPIAAEGSQPMEEGGAEEAAVYVPSQGSGKGASAAAAEPAGDLDPQGEGISAGPTPLDYPVAVLQLATRRGAYLVDMQTLTAHSDTGDDADSEQQILLARLSACLGQLFQHPLIIKLGFKAAPDFEKLACSYPDMPCFRRINSVIDTCTLAQQSLPALIKAKRLPASVLQGKPLKQLGLSRLCQVVLGGKGLNKAQQCSAWHLRPLTPEQMVYAALDAATLLPILDFFTEKEFADKAEPLSVDSLLQHKLYRTLVFSIKFSITTTVPTQPALAVLSLGDRSGAATSRTRSSRPGAGAGRSVLGVEVVSQQWAHSQVEPADYVPPPVLLTADNDEAVTNAVASGRTKGRLSDNYPISDAVISFLQASSATRSPRLPGGSVPTAADFLGKYISQNKDSCIAFAQALLHQGTSPEDGEVDDAEEGALSSAPASTPIATQGRKQGNMLLLKDTMLLFVNCTNTQLFNRASKDGGSRFLDQGRYFTWVVHASHVVRENSTRATKTRSILLNALLHGSGVGSDTPDPASALADEGGSILVFVRQNAAPYVFCGSCGVASLTAVSPESDGTAMGVGGSAVKVLFELLEHDALIQAGEGTGEVSLYKQMILDHR